MFRASFLNPEIERLNYVRGIYGGLAFYQVGPQVEIRSRRFTQAQAVADDLCLWGRSFRNAARFEARFTLPATLGAKLRSLEALHMAIYEQYFKKV